MDCPGEILNEIASHIRVGSTTSLRDLQMVVTCKALYYAVRPLVSNVMVRLLARAKKDRVLMLNTFEHASSRKVFFTTTPCDDVDTIWSVHHFFSESGRLDGVCTFVCTLKVHPQWTQWRPTDLAAWTRALRRLLDIVAGHPSVELELVGFRSPTPSTFYGGSASSLFVHERSPLAGRVSVTSASVDAQIDDLADSLSNLTISSQRPQPLGCAEPDAYTPFAEWVDELGWRVRNKLTPRVFVLDTVNAAITDTRLSSLHLFGGIFHPVVFSSLDRFVRSSVGSLTQLHINNADLTAPDWHAVLRTWRFTQLTHFNLEGKEIPAQAIMAFLRQNTSLSDLTLLIHENSGAVPLLIDPRYSEDPSTTHLPNLRSIVANTGILCPLLEASITLPVLESLTISENPQDLAKVTAILSLLPKCAAAPRHISLSLAYEEHLADWLCTTGDEAGSPAKGTADELYKAISCLSSVTSLHFTVHKGTPIPKSGHFGYHPVPVYVSPAAAISIASAFPSLDKLVLR
ncbi:hypothetical protein D9611_011116 [Ephemerocybe angulata]|uniref:F-box domain-containing protein n=1 Tax=Ephemerocybe angulata TaxID=980116 RepID=A0A8H5CDA1_9AGAR|nr:hypothetical protein D9611_011116 [Tulosesus angulatus]